jgi:hypothetical protein
LIFLLPLIVFLAGISFGLGEWSRSPILIFVLPVALFLICGFFLWEWSPDWLDPRINRALMLADPTGFRWLKETYLDIDRGVTFYNQESIPLDGPFVASRVAFICLGLGTVWLAQRHLARSLKGARPRATAIEKALTDAAARATAPYGSVPAPLSTLGMTTRRPGLLAGALRVARVEFRELLSSPGLYIFVPLIVLLTVVQSMLAVGAFDTPLLATPGTLAVASMAPLSVMVCLLLLFYTTESILREQTIRLDSIAYATPVRTVSTLVGKVAAGAVVGSVILLAALATDLVVLAIQGKVPIDLKPFGLVWGLLMVPTFLLWTSFVAAVVALTRNRYATYAIGLAVLIFSGYWFLRGEMNWLGNWPIWSAVQWSDMSVLEYDWWALVLNRSWVLALALLFTSLTGLWFSRRERDPSAIAYRLRPANWLWTGLKLLPGLAASIGLGCFLWISIERGPEGGAAEKMRKDYWKQNLQTWKDYPLPSIESVDLDIEFEPDSSSFQLKGAYRVANKTEKPLRSVPLTANPLWRDPEWTWDGQEAEPEDRSGLFVFTPEKPLAPGDRAEIGFRYGGAFPSGISSNGGGASEFIVGSGIVLTSFGPSFLPLLGFEESIGVDDENKSESKRYPDDFFEGKTQAGFGSGELMTTRIKVTTPARLTVNSVGRKVEETEKDGKRTVVWESDEPVHFFNIVAGEWAVKRGKGTAVYYHAAHTYNVETMSKALDAARKYYSEWFHPYPWEELKLSEFPALAGYAQGFPTNITFSESIGFLTDAREESDAAFLVAAHESAHQWWGNLLLPGKGPGGNVLSEGMAHYSTALLMEQVLGPKARIEFCKRIEKKYNKERNADEERSLYLTEGSLPTDSTVTYDRGGWVFWMLHQHLGREKMLEGLRAFIAKYRVTDDFPVLQDLVAHLRPYATDPDAYDAFVAQWFADTCLPEFLVASPKVEKTPDGKWKVTATIENAGTGQVRVVVAAEAGERFDKDGKEKAEYKRSTRTVALGKNEKKRVAITCDFDPGRLIVDPDALILQFYRDKAKAEL